MAAPERPVAPPESELRERVAVAAVADREALPPAKFAGDDPGTAAPMVIGGTETSISSAPWMAQLWYHDDQGTPEYSSAADAWQTKRLATGWGTRKLLGTGDNNYNLFG